MLIRKPNDIPSSEITPESVYLDRRKFIADATKLTVAGAAGGVLLGQGRDLSGQGVQTQQVDWTQMRSELGEKLNSYEHVTTHNNYYEFGTGKTDPARNSQEFQPRPWSITVEGECANPGTFDLEDFIKPSKMEDRIYRLRCVEAWSMVIPWRGFPLKDVIDRAAPTGNARFVEFTTLHAPDRMPGQRRNVLRWPYVEGLRLDEATHPLTILVTGVYGRDLPNQNGAPLRLIVPWKYGFKGIKGIVKMRFTERMPRNSWAIATPKEYGFYANVNPEVDHPRWSQAREDRLSDKSFGFIPRRNWIPTRMFNGYGDQVAHLYDGMDLRANF